MAKISAALETQLKLAPDQLVDLIVRTQGDASPHLAWVKSTGITVNRQFRLTPGLAVTCSGVDALKLADQDWVISVELDQPVKAL